MNAPMNRFFAPQPLGEPSPRPQPGLRQTTNDNSEMYDVQQALLGTRQRLAQLQLQKADALKIQDAERAVRLAEEAARTIQASIIEAMRRAS